MYVQRLQREIQTFGKDVFLLCAVTQAKRCMDAILAGGEAPNHLIEAVNAVADLVTHRNVEDLVRGLVPREQIVQSFQRLRARLEISGNVDNDHVVARVLENLQGKKKSTDVCTDTVARVIAGGIRREIAQDVLAKCGTTCESLQEDSLVSLTWGRSVAELIFLSESHAAAILQAEQEGREQPCHCEQVVQCVAHYLACNVRILCALQLTPAGTSLNVLAQKAEEQI